MKPFVFAAIGVVLGFVLGGIGPRMDLTVLQDKLTATEAELALAQQNGRSGRRPSLPVPGMSEMFSPPDDDFEEPEDVEASTEEGEAEVLVVDTGMPEAFAAGPEELAEEFDLAVDAQRLRAAQSRAALAEQADLSDADLDEFDNIVSDMNAELAEYGDVLMDIALSGEEPEAEEMLGLTHEVTGILYDTQTAVNDLVGTDGMEAADPSARQVWNHVDLEVFRDTVNSVQE
ncbi:MAG: hypothetical protein P8R54_05265 [Myxococcota bacterium]|nr:hypothetical protein [Myxococcota bacterium]